MATVNEKMTALADEIRELSGTTTVKSIDAMTTDVDAANTEVSSQTDLIAQITTALENKTNVPSEDVDDETNAYTEKLASLETAITALETELEGKASGGDTVETWTGTINNFGLGDVPNVYVYYTDANLVGREIIVGPGEGTITIAANTYIITHVGYTPPSSNENAENGFRTYPETSFKLFLPLRDNFSL